jgi:DNA-binding NtrC family response regulator
VIDNSDRARKLLAESLRSSATRLCLAASAEEALELAAKDRFDIAFADLHLSPRDGISVLWELRRMQPAMAAVIMAASGSLESAIEAMRLGVSDYLVKPLTHRKIVAAMERAESAVKMSAERRCIDATFSPASIRDEGSVTEVAACESTRRVFALAARCGVENTPAILHGEFGVGKETVARAIHQNSAFADRPFVKVNFSELTDRALHSILFRPEQPQTTADSGWSLRALGQGGTLYLEDAESLPPAAQRKVIEKLGRRFDAAHQQAAAPVRPLLIAGASKPTLIANEEFLLARAILDRWNGRLIEIAPLRSRPADIVPLAGTFLRQVGAGLRRPAPQGFSEDAIACLKGYEWPGNIFELRMAVRHAVQLCEATVISRKDLPHSVKSAEPRNEQFVQVPLLRDFRETQRQLACNAVARFGGNKTAAAHALGLNRRKLYRLLESDRDSLQTSSQ